MLNTATRTETTQPRTPFFSEMDLWVMGTYVKTALLVVLMVGSWLLTVSALAYNVEGLQQTVGDAQWVARVPAAAITAMIGLYVYFLIQRFWNGPAHKNLSDYIAEDFGR